MNKVFVDTGAFLAKEIQRDQHHVEAIEAWGKLSGRPGGLYTSEHCLDESATLLARRTNYAFAAGWGSDLLASGITLLRADPADLEYSFRLMRKFADQGVSFTDCLSFVLMKRERIRWVFGFDHHFAAAGFRLWSGRQER
ncbi:MAG TPA: PIN domain-containing protein [Opitutales bacterium]|nr:PIN domain-containing protein [Opitutales bacterium]